MVRRTLISLVLLSVVICCTARAQQATPAPAPATQAPTTPAAAAPAAKDETTDLVVARVFGQPITEKQVVSAINQIAAQQRISPDKMQQRNLLLFKTALDSLIRVALVKNQARLLNVTADPAQIDQVLKQYSQRFRTPEEFQKALASQGLAESDLRSEIEESIIVQKVLDQAVKGVPEATDAEIGKFYDENPSAFETPEQVHAAHILLRTDPKGTPEQKAEVKKKIEGILAEIEAKTLPFADAAAKYSEDPTNAKKGGDLGFFSRGQMVKPFEEAVFNTKPDSLSPIVETQFGYHIIKVFEIKAAGKASLEETKPKIKQYLTNMAKNKAAQNYVEDLKTKATIDTFMTAEEFAKRHPEK